MLNKTSRTAVRLGFVRREIHAKFESGNLKERHDLGDVGEILKFFVQEQGVRVSKAARSKASTVFGHSNIRIAGSNPARGMDVCLCFSVLCCPV
jgi:hypothetical protein